MRTTVSVGMAVVMALVGIQAIGTQASSSRDAAVVNGTNESAAAWNMSTQLFSGVGQTLAPTLVFGGVAAIVVVSLGMLVAAGRSGR